MKEQSRREFLRYSAITAGCTILFPVINSCTSCIKSDAKENVPYIKPADWNPIVFNRTRGNAGAIPEAYLKDINGPDGEKKHIGKHLPYIPQIDPAIVPKGYIPIMWGDASKGYTPHPNAPQDKANNYEGHWYNWIRIRKATQMWAETAESTYSGWPVTGSSDKGKYAVLSGDITADKGIHTIYLAALPPNVSAGDTVRIWGHCLTHGEYIDFIIL